jgi:hypothetical protein
MGDLKVARPSGAEAHVFLAALAARLEAVPFPKPVER